MSQDSDFLKVSHARLIMRQACLECADVDVWGKATIFFRHKPGIFLRIPILQQYPKIHIFQQSFSK